MTPIQYELTVTVYLAPEGTWLSGDAVSRIKLTGTLATLLQQTYDLGGALGAGAHAVIEARIAQDATEPEGAAE
jgi:hypothetical protein